MAPVETPKLRLYNTLTRQKEDFSPLDPGNVRMYVCGPTVYDYAHIGNARPVIVFDVLFRLLRHVYGADHVTYVRNITDVDDKIMNRARERGISIRELTEETNDQFQADMTALGCLEPTRQPRATETIDEMVEMIRTLVAKKFAYRAHDEVLFDVSRMKDYGRLSNRDVDDQLAGARVAVDTHKRNPGDFVLWKLSDPDQPGWDSPWGRGRPGWHIECSAMSDKWLWEDLKDRLSPDARDNHPHEFDIHGGGLDLIFPHHENEIAQSRCTHGTPRMAQVWMHNGYLQVEGQKMSKSLGNFVTVHDLLASHHGDVHRMTMLRTHYRQPIDWTPQGTTESFNVLARWERALRAEGVEAKGEQFSSEILDALSDDLNTPLAIQNLHGLFSDKRYQELADSLKALGFSLEMDKDAEGRFRSVTKDQIDSSIAERLSALANRDFETADRIRAELLVQGIQLMDYKDLVTGERRTKWEVKR